MDVTNRFVLDFAKRLRPAGARILDFGCGAGEVVAAGRAAGLDMLGADVFYGGSEARAARANARDCWARSSTRSAMAGWTSRSAFDLVTNNQVLEHVEDLDAVLREIHRVLKPGGTLLSIFPSRDVFREGHIGIPFSHWFPRDSRARFYYTWALRSAGPGHVEGAGADAPPMGRSTSCAGSTPTRTTARGRRSSAPSSATSSSELREPDYIRYRLRDSRGLAPLARLLELPGVPAMASAVFRKLAFLVIVSRKEAR